MRTVLLKLTVLPVLCSLLLACAHPGPQALAESDQPADPFSAMIDFYRGPLNHLAAVRSGECPMVPSDSAYGLQSIQRHGMLLGWVMAMDRLLRCGRDETRLAPKIMVNGRYKSYDPVENNDFWLKSQAED